MASLSHVLNSVASLISQRDSDLLDFSLVKTIFTFANISDALIIKVDRASRPISLIKFETGFCKKIESNESVDSIIIEAVIQARKIERDEYAMKFDGVHLNIFHLTSARGADSFLVIRSNDSLNPNQLLAVQGFSQIYKNYFALLTDSQRDQLTGLPNRKTFDDYIVKRRNYNEFITFDSRENERTGCLSWLVLIDVDNFKRINDDYGHLYGDEVLIHVSEILVSSIRDCDFAFRFGGEEFVLIINADNHQDCRAAVERIRENVAKKIFSNIGSVTISLGVAEFDMAEFYLTIIDNADKALYKSKQTGKNKSTFYSDMLKSGEVVKNNIKFGDIDLF